MTEDPHGTRSVYQQGCRCTPCKAANAAYSRERWAATQRGTRLLGAKISALETHRKIQALLLERMTKARIARELGLRRPILELHPTVITLRNALKVQRLYRFYMAGG